MKWMRPSGLEIELADTKNLNEFAKAQGWKQETKQAVVTEAATKVKRTRRTKAQMEEARNGNSVTSH